LAQDGFSQGPWEIELHGGTVVANSSNGGDLRLPPAGFPFTVTGGGTSNLISSWYFADGATLLNQVATQVSAQNRIVPIDAQMRSSAVRYGGLLGGVRLSRSLSQRLSAEFNLDYNHNALALRSSADSAFQRSQDSFVATWREVHDLHGVAAQVTTSRTDRKVGRTVALTATINLNLPILAGLKPYVLAGGGHSFDRSRNIVELQGSYEFTAIGVPIRETTVVAVRYDSEGGMLGVVGGGFKRDLSPRWGIRGDIRAHVHDNRTRAAVRSLPSFREGTPESGIFFSTSPRTIQFRNTSDVVASLGQSLTSFRTSDGTGSLLSLQTTFGFYRRF
jgi:hypothetical protein